MNRWGFTKKNIKKTPPSSRHPPGRQRFPSLIMVAARVVYQVPGKLYINDIIKKNNPNLVGRIPINLHLPLVLGRDGKADNPKYI